METREDKKNKEGLRVVLVLKWEWSDFAVLVEEGLRDMIVFILIQQGMLLSLLLLFCFFWLLAGVLEGFFGYICLN